jgi:hypothetical protein
MTSIFYLLCTQFYDDFPQVEPSQTSAEARKCATEFLDILGVAWSGGDKDKPFDSVFEPLGVRIDLSHMHDNATIEISNKPSRVSAICKQVDDVLESQQFPAALASELHGKLNFCQSQTFGRAAIPAIREIGKRAYEGGKNSDIPPRLLRAFEFVKDHLRYAPPRTIGACDPTQNILVFSDGAFESGKATWGFFIHDCADNSRTVAGADVPQVLVDHWLSTVGTQVITQVELYGILLARLFLDRKTLSRKVIYFLDNDAARDSLIRGFSDSNSCLSMIYRFYKCEREDPGYVWFSRVPSHSNIADAPSRGLASETAKAFGAALVEAGIEHHELEGLLAF